MENEKQESNEEEKKGSLNLSRRDIVQGLATVPFLGMFGWSWSKKDGPDTASDGPVIETPKEFTGKELNVAMLGMGAQGQVLLNSCLRIPGLKFKAVCDIWTDLNLKRAVNLLTKYGHEVTGYEDYREMLEKEKDLDAVIIATPDFWHAEHTIAFLEAGVHVYCEKEMSNTIEGARSMVEAQKRTGKLLQIGHQRRSNPRYIHCKKKLLEEADLLGRITTINGQWNRGVQPDLGWPKRYELSQEKLEKYGFETMHEFRNWRWYKGLGGGPIVDLGSHQIDIYNWFLESKPVSVMASGGVDYYEKDTHEWYDNIIALFEYQTEKGTVRASYQTITTNSSQGYFEKFMGDQGTLSISESANKSGVYREVSAPPWDEWVNKGYLSKPEKKETPAAGEGAVVDVRETASPESHTIPVELNDPYHQPHLQNFFDAIRGEAELNCPAEDGYETAVTVLKVNEAVEKGITVKFNPEEYVI
tara:strand:- start:6286 stop:7704 length:1419 start_codon:yes stop_codon:yes gene_type:complete